MKEQDYEHLPNNYTLGNLKLPDTSNIKLEKIVLSPLNESEGYRILEVVSTHVQTWVGNLIGITQCENLRIFLPLRFYVKSILVILTSQKLRF